MRKQHRRKFIATGNIAAGLGVPGLKAATEGAAQLDYDMARAALWAHNVAGVEIQALGRMTLAELAVHIQRHTRFDAVDIPTYVMRTIAALEGRKRTPDVRQRTPAVPVTSPTSDPWAETDLPGISKNVNLTGGRTVPECNCMIPFLDGAGQHAPSCAVFSGGSDVPIPDELKRVTPNPFAGKLAGHRSRLGRT